jgi:hypothetical protein
MGDGGTSGTSDVEKSGGIFQPKRHEQIFKQTKGHTNHCLWNVCLRHGNLMVALDQVHLGKNSASPQIGGKIQELQQRIFVLLRHRI